MSDIIQKEYETDAKVKEEEDRLDAVKDYTRSDLIDFCVNNMIKNEEEKKSKQKTDDQLKHLKEEEKKKLEQLTDPQLK